MKYNLSRVGGAGMTELADVSDLKSEALNRAWGFDSPSRHHTTHPSNRFAMRDRSAHLGRNGPAVCVGVGRLLRRKIVIMRHQLRPPAAVIYHLIFLRAG